MNLTKKTNGCVLPPPAGSSDTFKDCLEITYLCGTICMDTSGSNFISQKQRMAFTFSKLQVNASLVGFPPLAHWCTDLSLAILPAGDAWLPARRLRGLGDLFSVFPWPGRAVWTEEEERDGGCWKVNVRQVAWWGPLCVALSTLSNSILCV